MKSPNHQTMPQHPSGLSAARATPAALPGICHDAAVARIYEQLGSDITLITAPPGQPWALREAQQPPPPRETWALTHQLNLAEGNVAVALGKASGGLAALLASDRTVLADFIAANPALAGLLPVEHPAGSVVFIRAIGPMPPSRTLGGFTWLANEASLTVLTRSPRRWDAFDGSTSPRAPAPIRLEQLDWRPLGELGLGLLRDLLQALHGNAFRGPVAQQGCLNLPFWADLLPRMLRLRYHSRRSQFQQQEAGTSEWSDRSSLVVSNRLGEQIWELTQAWARPYRATPSELRALTARLRVLVAWDMPQEREFFSRCIEMCVVRCPGKSLTSRKLHDAIAAMHKQSNQPMPSATMAGRWINEAMQALFRAPQHRNLEHRGCWARGFRGFALRDRRGSEDQLGQVRRGSGGK